MKKLVIFNFWYAPMDTDMSEMGNVWYFKNYEGYFDKVIFVSLVGTRRETVVNGNSSYVFLGSGNNKLDLLFAPFKLYRYLKNSEPDILMSSELLLLWWIGSLAKIFLKKKIYLLPLTYPEQVYKLTGKSLTFKYPIWLDRVLLKLSYRFCDVALTAKGTGNFINWMREDKILKKKLVVADALPDCVPFPPFMKTLNSLGGKFEVRIKHNQPYTLINIGRFVKEKLTDHLIWAVSILQQRNINVELILIGNGEGREALIELSKELSIADKVKIIDYVPNGDLPKYLRDADLFVSPFTGGAFREAAVCGLPIIAYDIDWLKGMVVHKKEFYAVDGMDYRKFASGIEELILDPGLRQNLSVNMLNFAESIWSPKSIPASLKNVFA